MKNRVNFDIFLDIFGFAFPNTLSTRGGFLVNFWHIGSETLK